MIYRIQLICDINKPQYDLVTLSKDIQACMVKRQSLYTNVIGFENDSRNMIFVEEMDNKYAELYKKELSINYFIFVPKFANQTEQDNFFDSVITLDIQSLREMAKEEDYNKIDFECCGYHSVCLQDMILQFSTSDFIFIWNILQTEYKQSDFLVGKKDADDIKKYYRRENAKGLGKMLNSSKIIRRLYPQWYGITDLNKLGIFEL